ncbi:shikimate dehydrogenase [Marinisporobacter balticus]|uniref:Shikimate dehydrogenase (NADP(+)) n=1 Tax=Marinisporobacter balticus TaxID=2018667 RepID=A0A4R2KS34_9FIRM|nr:shikimate dehydrogenase [Marinisporobacter balticus]TCO73816.1 shikimate dehydrogenase [Marinisporobacter balticus]
MGIYGLIGEKLSHSFSPIIHKMIFEELRMEGHYHLFELKKQYLRDGLYGLKALSAKGVNVTIPYKMELMKYLDHISDEARQIGAINTICFKDNQTIGYNTDYYGFGMMLEKNQVDLQGKKAVILGTGGASKAVLQYLIDHEIEQVTFVSRDIEKTKKIYIAFECISYDQVKDLRGYDLMINCTPVGMYPNIKHAPVSKETVKKFKTIIDLIYNPKETLFLEYAKEEGLKSINGLYMLVGQAIKAQELWNDIKIDRYICDRIYEKICAIRNE